MFRTNTNKNRNKARTVQNLDNVGDSNIKKDFLKGQKIHEELLHFDSFSWLI